MRAHAFGLYPRKGVLQAGSDADVAIVDLTRRETIRATLLHSSRSKINPFDGAEVQGVPIMTIVRGKIFMRDGDAVGRPGCGSQVRPSMPLARVRNAYAMTRAITARDAIVVQ